MSDHTRIISHHQGHCAACLPSKQALRLDAWLLRSLQRTYKDTADLQLTWLQDIVHETARLPIM